MLCQIFLLDICNTAARYLCVGQIVWLFTVITGDVWLYIGV